MYVYIYIYVYILGVFTMYNHMLYMCVKHIYIYIYIHTPIYNICIQREREREMYTCARMRVTVQHDARYMHMICSQRVRAYFYVHLPPCAYMSCEMYAVHMAHFQLGSVLIKLVSNWAQV